MKINNFIKEKQAFIEKKWFSMVIETYPHDTVKFLTSQSDPVANPVGEATIKGLSGIIQELITDMNSETIKSHLDAIIRIRAVQRFTAAQAVGFVFFLKQIIRQTIKNEDVSVEERLGLEDRIDTISLLAFDVYSRCKETLYQLKDNELRKRVYGAFERAGLVSDLTAPESDKIDHNKQVL